MVHQKKAGLEDLMPVSSTSRSPLGTVGCNRLVINYFSLKSSGEMAVVQGTER